MYEIKDLIEYFPYAYRSKYLTEVVRCCQIEIEKLFEDILASENEYAVSTSEYMLEAWSNMAGIDYSDEIDLDSMRSNILGKMKSNGTTTVDVIKKIAESYSNGTCEVIESYADYSFTIKFISTIGVPEKIGEIKKIIDKVKPAHLAYDFEFKYRTWGDIKSLGKTWGYWKNKGKTYRDLKERSVE